jgi:hypothetical protein
VATATTLWADESGVRVSVDWSTDLDDLSVVQALALASALTELASVEPPALACCRER